MSINDEKVNSLLAEANVEVNDFFYSISGGQCLP